MKKFVNIHQKLLQKIPEFINSDFAQIKWLSEEIYLLENQDENIENKWRKLSNNSLYYIIIYNWKEYHEIIKWIFINENNNDDKEEIKLNRYLKIEKDDMIFTNS